MNKIPAVLLVLISFNASANCPSDILGRWDLTKGRMQPSDSWEDLSGPYWQYQADGKVKVILGLEHSYSCAGNKIIMDTPIESTFEIMKKTDRSMEVKVNDGSYGYFIIEKKS